MTDYTVIRSRRRTMSLQVQSDGSAVVRAPYGISEAQIKSFVVSHEAWLQRAQARQAERQSRHPEPTEEERKALLQRAREILPERVAYWSERMGLYPTGIKITSAKTRFGSCSSRDSLCFSWRLMAYPQEAIDLVIVHELCHIRHHNHGKEFYRLLASILPDHKERLKLLR